MRKIFIKVRRIVVPLVTLALLSISLAGCAPYTARELSDTIREGGSVVVEHYEEQPVAVEPVEPVEPVVEPEEPVEEILLVEDDTSTEMADAAPVDPNRVLPSGYTLGEIWLKVREGYAWYIGMGFTPAEAAEAADDKAREHGTTFAELHRITEEQMAAVLAPVVVPTPEPEPVVVVEQPAPRPQQPRPQQPAQPAQPAQVVSTLPIEIDRNRNNLDDAFEANEGKEITFPQHTPEERAFLEEFHRSGGILRPAGE